MTESGPATVAVVGAGKLGTTLARGLVASGHRTIVSGRADPVVTRLVIDAVAPGAEVATVGEAVVAAEVAVLALPLHRLPELPRVFASVLTIDATNYWEATDGALPSFVHGGLSLSESVAALLGAGRLVKTLNHVGYHDLDLAFTARGRGRGDRLAVGVAGDEAVDRLDAAQIVESLGLDPVLLPSLAAGQALEAGRRVFGARLTSARLHLELGLARSG